MELQPPLFSGDTERNTYTLKLYGYGKSPERLPPGHVFGPVTGTAWLLQYCVEGQGVIEMDGASVPLKKGECIVTFPGQQRTERADAQDPWAFLWISLQGESAGHFFEKMGLTPEAPVLPNCGRSNIPTLMDQIVDMADAMGYQDDFMLGAKLFAFFDACLRFRQEMGQPSRTGSSGGYAEQAVYYLNMHYTRTDLTVAELAKQLGLNRSYLYEVFKAETGVSPQEYLTRLRIRKSCELLQLPQVTAASAAYSVGYEPSVFSKAFKRTMGMTPAQYKRNYK